MTVLQLIGGAIVAYIAIFLAFVLLRKAKSPEKSWINCTLNVALQPLRMFKIGPYKHGKISIEGSMKQAMKKTKLSDFGGSPAEFCNMYNLVGSSNFAKFTSDVSVDFEL